MTVILALSCADGVVLAADSQATESDMTRFEVDKIFELTERIIWAGSGSSAIISELNAEFIKNKSHFESAVKFGVPLAKYARPVLDKHYSSWIAVPGKNNIPPSTSLIACGVRSDGTPWIMELSDNCQVTDYSDRGFHAIGSGSTMAQVAAALSSHYDLPGKPIPFGQLVAYRSLNAVIETSAYGVGHPIKIWTVTAEGIAQVSADEIRALSDRVGGWQQMEVETLEQLMAADGPQTEPVPTTAIPPPTS